MHVGDMLKAFASGALARPMACVGLCGSSESLDFAKTEAIHFLKSRLLTDNTFMIPGFNMPPATAPSDGITVPAPTLNALAWSGQHIQIHEQDEEKCGHHESFENEFNVLKNAMLCANGLAKTVVSDAPIKNEGGADVGDDPPSKKLRLSIALSFIDAATIQTDILSDLPLLTVNGVRKDSNINLILRICANSILYLVNAGTQHKDDTSTQGSLLADLGKGKWQTTITGDSNVQRK